MKKLAANFRYVGEALEGKPVLKGSDGEFIAGYCSNLGTTDASSQIDLVSHYIVGLDGYYIFDKFD